MKSHAHLVLISLSMIAIVLLSSCAKKESGTSAPPGPIVQEVQSPQQEPRPEPQPEKLPEFEPQLTGQYMGVLETVNAIVTGPIMGAVTISREGDEFVGDVRFSGGPLTASVLHVQALHAGERCPTSQDDLNLDGFIDALEAEAVYGKVWIPLDGDLNAQHLELGTYPVADEFGSYVYSETASFEKFMRDLREADINPEDYLLKLDANEALNLQGMVAVITGISHEANLPNTVATTSRFTNFQTLPIACTVLTKITSVPGSVDEDRPRNPPSEPAGGDYGQEDGTIIAPPPRDWEIPTPAPTSPPSTDNTTPEEENTEPPVNENV